LQEEIELYSVDGNVAVIGDLNGRVGKETWPLETLRREDLLSWSIRFPKILGCFKSSVNLSQNISSGTYSIKFAILSFNCLVNPVVNLHFKIKTDVLLLIICYCPVNHFL
jgi:hypothetical protein